VKALRSKAARAEAAGDLEAAFAAYEEAVGLEPRDPDLLMALARLAGLLDMSEQAVKLWAHLSLAEPADKAVALGHARALVEAGRLSEAIERLQSALMIHPEEPRLWASLGLALTYAGRAGEAMTFLAEAERLAPQLAIGAYNRGLALCDLGREAEAAAAFETARKLAKGPEKATVEFSLATLALGRGDLAAGWPLYERRLSPDWPKFLAFEGAGKRLTEGDAVVGRSVLVLAEQGIGDEIMFAGLLPALIAEAGRVVVAVDPRLVDLLQRSFPSAEVVAHSTPRVGPRPRRRTREPVRGRIDYWVPLASLAQRYRASIEAFPRAAYLVPDPERVAAWKGWLGEGPALGVAWRRGKSTGESQRRVPPLEGFAAVLRGRRLVNLQYGDCGEDLARLRELGARIEEPDLDLRQDMEGLAALCAALTGVVGVPNATTMLAGAVGAPTLYLTGPGSWFELGQDEPPWFARGRMCRTPDFSDWSPALGAAEAALGRLG
jgi:tetratricopeptide (TPR) repeat protein